MRYDSQGRPFSVFSYLFGLAENQIVLVTRAKIEPSSQTFQVAAWTANAEAEGRHDFALYTVWRNRLLVEGSLELKTGVSTMGGRTELLGFFRRWWDLVDNQSRESLGQVNNYRGNTDDELISYKPEHPEFRTIHTMLLGALSTQPYESDLVKRLQALIMQDMERWIFGPLSTIGA